LATYKRPTDGYDLLRRMDGVDLTLAERAVLLAQYKFADRDGTNSRPNLETLATYLSVSERTVRVHRTALRDKGWLIEKRRGRNVGRSNLKSASVYEVVIPTGRDLPVADLLPEGEGVKAQEPTGRILPPTYPSEDQSSTGSIQNDPWGTPKRVDDSSADSRIPDLALASGSSAVGLSNPRRADPLDSKSADRPHAAGYMDDFEAEQPPIVLTAEIVQRYLSLFPEQVPGYQTTEKDQH
jgi:hypothetical protein